MGTQLTWNSLSDRYEATVDGQHIEVDGDAYVEVRRDMMRDMAKGEGIEERDPADWPEEVYNRLYEEAEKEIEQAEAWIDRPMYGLSIDGEPQW